ncbi:MAG: hypothetical protein H5T69_04265 [Chloroflexi bacterium]|nr:hypothetical protein [Chloroflexota bacterium]
MSDQQLTAAAIIRFCENLQDDSARFYEQLAQRFPEHRRTFQGYAQRCERNKVQIVRTYQETVTDALETGFSFEGLDLPSYQVNLILAEGAGLREALEQAIALEDKAIAFYQDVAQRAQSLLATIPRAFERVAERRGQRREELEALRRSGA